MALSVEKTEPSMQGYQMKLDTKHEGMWDYQKCPFLRKNIFSKFCK